MSGKADPTPTTAPRDNAELGVLLCDNTDVELGLEVLRLRAVLRRIAGFYPSRTDIGDIAKKALKNG